MIGTIFLYYLVMDLVFLYVLCVGILIENYFKCLNQGFVCVCPLGSEKRKHTLKVSLRRC